jgi:hypothetical protein
MREIWIPEFFIAFFLFLALIRRRVKGLLSLRGIVWFPLAAFLLSIGLFPAYGFRPEALPLVVFSIVITILHFPHMASVSGRVREEEYQGEKPFFTPILGLILLAAVLYPVFRFSPLAGIGPGPVYSFTLNDEDRGRSYRFRLYLPPEGSGSGSGGKRPLVVLSPPAFGAPALEDLCAELGSRGFAALSYTRQGSASPVELFRHFRAFRAGTRSASANAWGRALEEAERADILFILSRIGQNPSIGEGLSLFDPISRDAVFLAGYGAGASALVLLAGNPGFVQENPSVKGIIAVESPLWSLYRQEERVFETLPHDSGWLRSVRAGLGRWFASLKPKKITGLGEIPAAGFPVLYLVSDRVLDPKSRPDYEAAFRSLQRGKKPSVLASADGAGLFDYAGFPSRYPLLSWVFSGRKQAVWKDSQAAGGTAQIMVNFAALLLDAEGSGAAALKTEPLPRGIHLETGGWNLKSIGLY